MSSFKIILSFLYLTIAFFGSIFLFMNDDEGEEILEGAGVHVSRNFNGGDIARIIDNKEEKAPSAVNPFPLPPFSG